MSMKGHHSFVASATSVSTVSELVEVASFWIVTEMLGIRGEMDELPKFVKNDQNRP